MAAQRPENINEIILDTAEELLKVNSFSEVTLAKIAEKRIFRRARCITIIKAKTKYFLPLPTATFRANGTS